MRKIKKAMSVPHIWMYLVPLCIVLISCRFFQINIQALEQMRGEEIGLSVADYVVEFYKGELPYERSAQQPFNIPALWSLYFIYFFAVTGKRISSSFSKYQQQILLRKKTRGHWWMSCMGGIFLESAVFLAVSFLGFLIFGIFSGAEINGNNTELQWEYNGLMLKEINTAGLVMGLAVLSLVVMNTLASVQCVLSVMINAVAGFIVPVAVLAGSAFFRLPLLIFNYLMLLRYERFAGSGVNAAQCLAVCIPLTAVMLYTGGRIIKKKDFF